MLIMRLHQQIFHFRHLHFLRIGIQFETAISENIWLTNDAKEHPMYLRFLGLPTWGEVKWRLDKTRRLSHAAEEKLPYDVWVRLLTLLCRRCCHSRVTQRKPGGMVAAQFRVVRKYTFEEKEIPRQKGGAHIVLQHIIWAPLSQSPSVTHIALSKR